MVWLVSCKVSQRSHLSLCIAFYSANRGGHRPIMNLHERSLSVLACRYADEVIIGAPGEVSKDMVCNILIDIITHPLQCFPPISYISHLCSQTVMAFNYTCVDVLTVIYESKILVTFLNFHGNQFDDI